MQIQPDRLKYLLRRYLENRCTREEMDELYACLADNSSPEVQELVGEVMDGYPGGKENNQANWDQMFGNIIRTTAVTNQRRNTGWWKYAAAAVLLLLATVITYRFVLPPGKPSMVAKQVAAPVNDITPGTNKAVLTLADGSTVTLDSSGNQVLQQGKTAVRQQGGQLQYQAVGSEAEVTYNVLSTPRGGQFQLTLPDGSRVWLNAASSLKFPVAFTGKQRDVTLKGEAYFEVVHNDKMPFRVLVEGMEIKDLGTHFNVMAYGDEPVIAATLLEGAVAVTDGKKTALLKPGQQAVAKTTGNEGLEVKQADADHVVAWKNGEFSFEHTSIKEVMRQVARWYDVDVDYQLLPEVSISGNISKHVNVSEVFRMLEVAGNIKFRLDNRKATMMK